MHDNGNISGVSDLLEFLNHILGRAYISDSRIESYNTMVKLILKQ